MRRQGLKGWIALGGILVGASATAADDVAVQRLREAQELHRAGQFFKAARYAFTAGEESEIRKAEAQAWVAASLMEAGLEQSASYFFIQSLRSGNREAIRRVLPWTGKLVRSVGLEFVRPYLVKNTRAEDYPASEKQYYQYAFARTAMLKGDLPAAIGVLSEIPAKAKLRAELLQIRATVRVMSGSLAPAIADFKECAKSASEGSDLRNRCVAGQARTLYEQGDYAQADQVYDQVAKASLVWPDILFEQAWNSYRRSEFNRTLGKLVSYKSPALSFVYNPEIDVLRAQAYLALCLYNDANEGVNDFNSRYAPVSDEVKKLTEKFGTKLQPYFDQGKEAALAPLGSKRPLHRLMNRFVRSAAFQDWVRSERELSVELGNIKSFSAGGAPAEPGNGTFPQFLSKVLDFRLKAIREMGGAFVRNSLLDYHDDLIAQFEKIAFIKLEMLRRFKEQLMTRKTGVGEDRGRGNVAPVRRDDQYFWSFNGEFWNDELGDYVFGLESECNGRS